MREIRSLIERIVSDATLYLDRLLRLNPEGSVTGTPVDTGHARANWVPSVGAPHLEEVATVRVANTVGSAAHAAGVTRVLAYRLADGATFVNNAVPYILQLNDGWSAQQPLGFIERAIDETNDYLERKYRDARIVIGTTETFGARGAENLASAYSPLGGD